MKNILFAAAAASLAFAGSAMAWEARTVACYDKHWVGPTYKYKQVKIKDAKEKYVYKGDHKVELVRYDALYLEKKIKVKDGMWVMKKVACKH